jgi:hypothetical protein
LRAATIAHHPWAIPPTEINPCRTTGAWICFFFFFPFFSPFFLQRGVNQLGCPFGMVDETIFVFHMSHPDD